MRSGVGTCGSVYSRCWHPCAVAVSALSRRPSCRSWPSNTLGCSPHHQCSTGPLCAGQATSLLQCPLRCGALSGGLAASSELSVVSDLSPGRRRHVSLSPSGSALSASHGGVHRLWPIFVRHVRDVHLRAQLAMNLTQMRIRIMHYSEVTYQNRSFH